MDLKTCMSMQCGTTNPCFDVKDLLEIREHPPHDMLPNFELAGGPQLEPFPKQTARFELAQGFFVKGSSSQR